MADTTIPAWKFWHPLALWKVFAVLLVTNIVCQPLMAGLATLVGMSGGTGATLGAGLAGALGVGFIIRLAAKAKAEAEATPADGPPES